MHLIERVVENVLREHTKKGKRAEKKEKAQKTIEALVVEGEEPPEVTITQGLIDEPVGGPVVETILQEPTSGVEQPSEEIVVE